MTGYVICIGLFISKRAPNGPYNTGRGPGLLGRLAWGALGWHLPNKEGGTLGWKRNEFYCTKGVYN
jgi:hypothetical protein